MQDIETGKIKFTVSPTVPGSGGSPPLGPKEGGGGPRGAGGSSSLGWVLNIFTHDIDGRRVPNSKTCQFHD